MPAATKKLDVFDGWRSKVSKTRATGNMPQYRQLYDDFGADQVANSSGCIDLSSEEPE
jgi:hypothetical protein